MGSNAADADINPTPSPAPASDVRLASAIEHALARTDFEGARSAQEMYGDDEDLEIAALAEGNHPFQCGLSADALVASRREAAELLAARP
jgi:hypothetical protein